MTLKHLRRISVALALVVSTSGCSYLLGPKPEEPKPFEKKSAGDCIGGVPANLTAWLKDGKADIGASVDCSVAALTDFTQHVAGQTKNVYTESELKDFIAQFLIPANSPQAGHVDDLTKQILKVKQIMIGGSADLMTNDELARFKSVLLRVRPLLVDLSPSIQTLLFNAPKASIADVTTASNQLTAVLNVLAEEFDRSEPGRPEIGFQELLKSAQSLGLKNDSVANWIPLAESVKALVLAGDPNLMRASEWSPMLRMVGQAWGLALRWNYNLLKDPEYLGKNFSVTEASLRQVLALADQAVAAHNGAIPLEEFENLIDALGAKDLMPRLTEITLPSKPPRDHVIGVQTLKDALPVVFGKFLYGRSHPDFDLQSRRFGAVHLARVHAFADDWIAGQTLINSALKNRLSLSVTQFGQSLAAAPVVRPGFVDDQTFQMAIRARKQLLQFVSKGRPPIHDDGGRLIVVTRNDLPAIKKSDLDFMNQARILLEAVLTGWTHDAVAAANVTGLTEAETQEAYVDLRNIGKDLNFIDIRSNQAGTRTFMENSIFMSTSDNDGYMGLQEGVEWMNFVVSGAKVADKMWHAMEPICGTTKIDVLGNQKLNAACFRREFLKRWAASVPNLPRLVEWAKQDGSGQRSEMMLHALEMAGRNRGATDSPVESSEFRAMIPVAHYLESMFARHDVNQNGVLDNDELWEAFPLLAPFIKKMGNGQADGEDLQKTIFSYLLTFGEVPQTDLVGMAKLGGWYLVHGWFDQSADREKVLGVIGAFPAASKIARAKSIEAYYDKNKEALRQLLARKEPTNALQIADVFQCLPTAAPILSDDFAQALDRFAPKAGDIGADNFTTQVKALIDQDEKLEPYCLPF